MTKPSAERTERADRVLDVERLSTTFLTPRGPLRAVHDISLHLDRGETLGLVGESGSGKSVLGRTIMGLITTGDYTRVGGKVLLDGVDVHAISSGERRALWGPKVAMVFQDPMTSLNPVRRIGTHLAGPLRQHMGMDKKQAQERGAELLAQVGIPDPRRRLSQYPHELSGGMRQRVMIALALTCEPELLIADEPTTALDVTVQKQILDLLSDLAERLRMATILVSHDLGAVANNSHRVAVMYAGGVVETSETQQVFQTPYHPYADELIASIPQLDNDPHTVLRTIEGRPPDLISPPPGCRFAPRCPRAVDVCRVEPPPLEDLAGPGDYHAAACHVPLVGEGVVRSRDARSTMKEEGA